MMNNIMRSGPMRMMGMASGMDTDFIIQQSMRIHQMKIDARMRSRTLLEWRQQAHTGIRDELRSFRQSFLTTLGPNAMLSSSVFNTSKALLSVNGAAISSHSAFSVRTNSTSSIGSFNISRIESVAKGASVSTVSGLQGTTGTPLSPATRLGSTGAYEYDKFETIEVNGNNVNIYRDRAGNFYRDETGDLSARTEIVFKDNIAILDGEDSDTQTVLRKSGTNLSLVTINRPKYDLAENASVTLDKNVGVGSQYGTITVSRAADGSFWFTNDKTPDGGQGTKIFFDHATGDRVTVNNGVGQSVTLEAVRDTKDKITGFRQITEDSKTLQIAEFGKAKDGNIEFSDDKLEYKTTSGSKTTTHFTLMSNANGTFTISGGTYGGTELEFDKDGRTTVYTNGSGAIIGYRNAAGGLVGDMGDSENTFTLQRTNSGSVSVITERAGSALTFVAPAADAGHNYNTREIFVGSGTNRESFTILMESRPKDLADDDPDWPKSEGTTRYYLLAPGGDPGIEADRTPITFDSDGRAVIPTANDVNPDIKLELNEKNGSVALVQEQASSLAVTHGTTKVAINGKEITLNRNMTLNEMMSHINGSGAGVSMTFDRMTNEISLESTTTGANSTLRISGQIFESLGLINVPAGYETNPLDVDPITGRYRATIDDNGTDAVVVVNAGTATEKTFTSSTNSVGLFDNSVFIDVRQTFNIEGMPKLDKDDPGYKAALDAFSKSTEARAAEVSVNITRNVDDAVEKIKSFVDSYNAIIKRLESLLNERKTGNEVAYKPLTDEEKSAMSDKQVEEWEAIAKKGILRGDTGLQNMLSSLRGALFEKVAETGLSPSDIGISTGSYFSGTGGQIVINEDRLRAALEKDPDQVMNVFIGGASSRDYKERGLLYRMNDITGNYLSNSQNLTFESLDRSIRQTNAQIEKLQEKMWREEDLLYKKFAAMETALSQMQSQGDWFTAMLGGMK